MTVLHEKSLTSSSGQSITLTLICQRASSGVLDKQWFTMKSEAHMTVEGCDSKHSPQHWTPKEKKELALYACSVWLDWAHSEEEEK